MKKGDEREYEIHTGCVRFPLFPEGGYMLLTAHWRCYAQEAGKEPFDLVRTM
jgi:hypothetical protein